MFLKRPNSTVGRYAYFMLALVVIAIGVWFNRQSRLGLGPWGTFQQGISNVTGIAYGTVISLVGLVIIVACIPFKVYPRPGTILNMLLIGVMIDGLEILFPIDNTLSDPVRWACLIISLAIGAFGTVMYIVPGIGAGPRDSLMIVLMRKFNKPAKVIKPIMEIIVITAGIIMGAGDGFGPGTVISILFFGALIDLTAKYIFKIDIKKKPEKNIKK